MGGLTAPQPKFSKDIENGNGRVSFVRAMNGNESSQTRKVGRPMRYGPFILILADWKLYGVDTVVENAKKKKLFRKPPFNEEIYGIARRKAFDALSKYRKKRLPREPDGRVVNRVGVPMDGWYGWRWKAALPEVFRSAYSLPDKPPERILKRMLTINKTASEVTALQFPSLWTWLAFLLSLAVLLWRIL